MRVEEEAGVHLTRNGEQLGLFSCVYFSNPTLFFNNELASEKTRSFQL